MDLKDLEERKRETAPVVTPVITDPARLLPGKRYESATASYTHVLPGTPRFQSYPSGLLTLADWRNGAVDSHLGWCGDC